MLPKNGGKKDKRVGDEEQNQAPRSEQPALLCILMSVSRDHGLMRVRKKKCLLNIISILHFQSIKKFNNL